MESKQPIITDKEVLIEVGKRTGFSVTALHQIIGTYYEVVEECVNSGVEVKTKIGQFGWNKKLPRKNVIYRNLKTGELMPPRDFPGYFYPKFIPTRGWRKRLKDLTLFTEEDKQEEKIEGNKG